VTGLGLAIYDPEVALRSDVNAILVAYKSRMEMYNQLLGGKPNARARRPSRAELLDFARTQTALARAGRLKRPTRGPA
jgi:hypothetical protein